MTENRHIILFQSWVSHL